MIQNGFNITASYKGIRRFLHKKILSCFFLLPGIFFLMSISVSAQAKEHTTENVDSLFTQAQVQLMVEHIDTAFILFQKVVTIQPDNAVAHAQLSRIYMMREELPDALSEIQTAMRLDKANKTYGEQYAALLYLQGNYEQAAKLLTRLSKDDPYPAVYLLKAEQCYFKGGQYQKAMEVLKQAEEYTGKANKDIIEEKVKLYILLRQEDSAVATTTYLIKTFPQNPQYYIDLAILYNDLGWYKSCDSILITAIKLFPKNVDVFKSALSYFIKRKNDGVKKLLEYVLYSDAFTEKEQMTLFYTLATFDKRSAFAHQLLYDYIPEIAQRDADNLTAKLWHAFILMEGKNKAKALSLFHEVVASDHSNYIGWYVLLNYYAMGVLTDSSAQRDLDSLKFYVPKAVQGLPGKPEPYYFLGLGFYNNKEWDSAAVRFNQALQLTPENDTAKIFSLNKYLGSAYANNHKLELAIKNYEQALLYNQGDIVLLNDYSYALAEVGEDLEKAQKMSAITLIYYPNDAAFLDTYGWILYKQKKFKAARTYIQKAIKIYKTPDATVYEHLGDIEYALGNKRKAQNYWMKAKAAGGDCPELLQKIESQ